MRIKVHRSAKVDLLDARLFYEEQQEGLRGFYKALSQRFPYSIYYRIVEGVVRIYAVLDNRANPSDNDERLDAADRMHP